MTIVLLEGDTSNLCIDEEQGPEFGAILQEIPNDTLQKRKDKLIETITSVINSATSIKEIESLEIISASMILSVAAARQHSEVNISFVDKGDSNKRDIILLWRLKEEAEQRYRKLNT